MPHGEMLQWRKRRIKRAKAPPREKKKALITDEIWG
jgi:hypothetical protein